MSCGRPRTSMVYRWHDGLFHERNTPRTGRTRGVPSSTGRSSSGHAARTCIAGCPPAPSAGSSRRRPPAHRAPCQQEVSSTTGAEAGRRVVAEVVTQAGRRAYGQVTRCPGVPVTALVRRRRGLCAGLGRPATSGCAYVRGRTGSTPSHGHGRPPHMRDRWTVSVRVALLLGALRWRNSTRREAIYTRNEKGEVKIKSRCIETVSRACRRVT
jgi:hypothetical protein